MNDVLTLLKDMSQRMERIERALGQLVEQNSPEKTPLYLDDALVTQFLRWSSEQGTSKKWLGDQRRYLRWWSECLDGIDLRSVSLADHILPALDEVDGGRAPRIAVLKRLFSWLRSVRHLLTPDEDPTLNALRVPQSRPAQLSRKKAFSRAEFRRVRMALEPTWRDVADVLAGTGWHFSELRRFAKDGAIEESTAGGGTAVLICPLTKGGESLRTAVSGPVRDAAARLLDRGGIAEKWFRIALKAASKKAGVEVEITPGRFRHAVATWAIDSGDDVAAVASFLGHRSPRTTRKFYAVHSTPRKVATLL